MSPSNKASVCTTCESYTPNLVLSVLTALSSSVLVKGKDGEATLSQQLAGVLQNNTMPVTELSLLYCYRFGYTITDALKYVGFDGELQDFVEQHNCFFTRRGCISLHSATAVVPEPPAGKLHEVSAYKPSVANNSEDEDAYFGDSESTTDAECHLDSDLDDDIASSDSEMAWRVLGGRVAAVLRADDEIVDKTPDPQAWCKVAGRIAGAFKLCSEDEQQQTSPCSIFDAHGNEGEVTLSEQLSGLLEYRTLAMTELSLLYCYRFGSTISDALKFVGFSGGLQAFLEQDPHFSVNHGCVCLCPSIAAVEAQPLGFAVECRKHEACALDETASTIDATSSAESLHHDTDSNIEVSSSNSIVAWKVLGGRIAAAFEVDDDEEDLPNPIAWSNVGSRVAAAFKNSSDDDDHQDSPDPEKWRNVGCRIAAAFQQNGEDEEFLASLA